jgi:hypothetical protein
MATHLKELFYKAKLGSKIMYFHQGGGTFPDTNRFPLNAKDFLRFSKQDLKTDGDTRGLINALTNIKRAIDCHIDGVFDALGVKVDKKNPELDNFLSYFKSDDNTSYKLKIIESLNLAPSFIVSETRLLRHKLEHHYEIPAIKEVERAYDVAELFISAVQGKLRGILDEFCISDSYYDKESTGKLYFNYSPDDALISSKGYMNHKYDYEIRPDNPLYYFFLRLIISCEDEFELTETITAIFKYINHGAPKPDLKLGYYL